MGTDKSKMFACSDHHFGHANIIKFCQRPVKNVEEDMRRMISGHNSVVSDNDLVFFVGDVSASRQGIVYLSRAMKELRGRKILIRGNHDHQPDSFYLSIGFESVHEVLVVEKYVFCHFPDHPAVVKMATERNLTLVCGHTHKPFPPNNFGDSVTRINVAIDVIGVQPREL